MDICFSLLLRLLLLGSWSRYRHCCRTTTAEQIKRVAQLLRHCCSRGIVVPPCRLCHVSLQLQGVGPGLKNSRQRPRFCPTIVSGKNFVTWKNSSMKASHSHMRQPDNDARKTVPPLFMLVHQHGTIIIVLLPLLLSTETAGV